MDGFRVTRHIDGDTDTLTVDQADPRVLVSSELLDDVRRGAVSHLTLVDDVLTINGSNRKVIYRIGEYLPDRDAYVAEWPD